VSGSVSVVGVGCVGIVIMFGGGGAGGGVGGGE